MDPLAKTVPLVPLSELTDLARLGLAMLKAQASYRQAIKDRPHCHPEAERRAAVAAEVRFRAATTDALSRERQTLPGMEGGGW